MVDKYCDNLALLNCDCRWQVQEGVITTDQSSGQSSRTQAAESTKSRSLGTPMSAQMAAQSPPHKITAIAAQPHCQGITESRSDRRRFHIYSSLGV